MNKWSMFFLCLFLGCIGAHRFITGKFWSGLLYLFTCGVCGIGIIIDLIDIYKGSFQDANGVPIL